MDYYEVLGVTKTASPEAIQSAYRRAAMRWHPEKNQGRREAEETFRKLAQAYAVLSTPEARKRYDEQMTRGEQPDSAPTSTVDTEIASMIFLQEMDDLASELRAYGIARDSIADSLVKRGCPEGVARQAAEGKGAGRRIASAVARGAEPKPEPAKQAPPVVKPPPVPFSVRRWALLAHGLLILVSLPFIATPPRVVEVPATDIPGATVTPTIAPGPTVEPVATPADGAAVVARLEPGAPQWLLSLLPLPIIVSYGIYLRNRRQNEWLAFHGLQAAIFQLLIAGLSIIFGFPSGFTLLLIGAVYAFIALVFVSVGWEFKYLFIGNLAAGIVRRIHG